MWYSKTGKKEYTFSYRDTLTSIQCDGKKRLFSDLKADATWTKDTIFDDTLEAVTKNAVLDLLQPPKTVTYEVSWVGDKYQFCLKKGDEVMMIHGKCVDFDSPDIATTVALVDAHDLSPTSAATNSSDGTINSNDVSSIGDSSKSRDLPSLPVITTEAKHAMIKSAIVKASELLDEMKFPSQQKAASDNNGASKIVQVPKQHVITSGIQYAKTLFDKLSQSDSISEHSKSNTSASPTDSLAVPQLGTTISVPPGYTDAEPEYDSDAEHKEDDPDNKSDNGEEKQGKEGPESRGTSELKNEIQNASMITSGIQYARKLLDGLHQPTISVPKEDKNAEKNPEKDDGTLDATVSPQVSQVEIAARIKYAETLFDKLSKSGPSGPVGVPHAGVENAEELLPENKKPGNPDKSVPEKISNSIKHANEIFSFVQDNWSKKNM